MSKIMYDDEKCEQAIQSLGYLARAFEDAASELKSYLNSLPSDSKVENKLTEICKCAERDSEGKLIGYRVNRDKKVRKRQELLVPYYNAKRALESIQSDIASFSKNIDEMSERVRKVQSLVDEFEVKPNTKQSETVVTNGGTTGGGGGGSTIYTTTEEGDGKAPLNVDTDGDGKPDLNIDLNGDGKADLNIDTNNDGIPDINIDLDGDGKADLNIDVDNDGAPDINIDLDGDGKADLNIDTDNNGKPDLNIDLDGDGRADLNIDTDNNGKPDLNIDIDGDGTADLNIDTDGDGKPDVNIDADGDGKVDLRADDGNDSKPTHVSSNDQNPDEVTPEKPSSDPIFNKETAENTSGGFADNIVAGGVGMIGGSIAGGSGSGATSGGTKSTGEETPAEEAEALFAFLPGGASDSSDFMYRGLSDPTANGDLGSINYQSLAGGGGGVAKGAAAVAAVGLGVSGVDAFAAVAEQKKQAEDSTTSDDEKEEKKLIKTVISSGILGILTVAFGISVLNPNASIIAIILLGLAMAVSAIAATTGNKIGKYIGFGVLLVASLITFVLSAAGVISPVGYVVIFGSYVVLSIAAILLDLLKGMFDDKVDLIPIIITVAIGLLIAMFKTLNVINWIVFIILIILTVAGYFVYEFVLKKKMPSVEASGEAAVVYGQVPVQTEGPIVAENSNEFDPRALYQQAETTQPTITDRINTDPQNPFANYNPMNSSFANAFKNDDNSNNNNNNGMF